MIFGDWFGIPWRNRVASLRDRSVLETHRRAARDQPDRLLVDLLGGGGKSTGAEPLDAWSRVRIGTHWLPVWGTGGREFKSPRSDHKIKDLGR